MNPQVFEHSADNINQLANLFQQAQYGGDHYTSCMKSLNQLDGLQRFRSGLLQIGIRQEFPTSIRVFALSYLKNTLDAFWKRKRNLETPMGHQPHPLLAAASSTANQLQRLQQQGSQYIIDHKEPERTEIKQILLSHLFNESEDSIANLLSDIVSKIASHDFPHFWPEFVPGLMEALRSAVQTIAAFNKQSFSNMTPVDITPVHKDLLLGKRTFDTLELLLQAFVAKRLNSNSIIVDQLILRPHFAELFGIWNEFSSLLTTVIGPSTSTSNTGTNSSSPSHRLPSDQLQSSSTPYATTFNVLLDCVEMGIKALGHCVNCKAESLFSLSQGFTDQFFGSLGNTLTLYRQCVSSTHTTLSLSSNATAGALPMPAHSDPCFTRLNNTLRASMGHAIGIIHDTLSSTPLLFSTYLSPFLDLFLQVIQERAEERRLEVEMLSMEHAQGEIGLGWEDDFDDVDIRMKGGDMSVVNAFRFISTVLKTPAYQREVQSTVQMGVIMKQSQQQQLGINPEELLSTANSIARDKITNEMLQTLCHTIITSFIGYTRYDFKLLSNYYPPQDTELCEQFYQQERDRGHCDHETAAGISTLQVVFEVYNDVILSVIEQLYTTLVSQRQILFFDQQTSKAIRQSWSYDNLIYVLSTFLFDIKDNIDINMLYDLTLQCLQSFLNTQQQQQQQQGVSQRHFLFNVTLENGYSVHTTRFLRIIELCSNFTEIYSAEQLAHIWAIITPFLHYGNSAVQLTTVNTLKCIADSYNFKNISHVLSQIKSNSPSAQSAATVAGHSGGDASAAIPSILFETIESLIHICNQSSESSSKDLILTAIRLTIHQQDGETLRPLIPLLIHSLSLLWGLTDQQRHIRSKIIDIFSSIATTLNKDVLMLEQVLLQIITSTTVISENPLDDHSAYIESSLDLWLTVVRNTPNLTPAILDAFGNWVQIYSSHDDYFLEYGKLILQSYLLLDYQAIWSKYGEQVLSILIRIAQQFYSHLTLVLPHKKKRHTETVIASKVSGNVSTTTNTTSTSSSQRPQEEILDLTTGSSSYHTSSYNSIEEDMIDMIHLFTFIAQMTPSVFFMTKPSQHFLLALAYHLFGYFDQYYINMLGGGSNSPSPHHNNQSGDVIDHQIYTEGSQRLTAAYYQLFSVLSYQCFDELIVLFKQYQPTSPIQHQYLQHLQQYTQSTIQQESQKSNTPIPIPEINLGLHYFFNNFHYIFELSDELSLRKQYALSAVHIFHLPYHKYCYCYQNIPQLFQSILSEVVDDEVAENRYQVIPIQNMVIQPHTDESQSGQHSPFIAQCYEDIRAKQFANNDYSNITRLKDVVRAKLQHAATTLGMQSMCETLAHNLPQNLYQVLMND